MLFVLTQGYPYPDRLSHVRVAVSALLETPSSSSWQPSHTTLESLDFSPRTRMDPPSRFLSSNATQSAYLCLFTNCVYALREERECDFLACKSNRVAKSHPTLRGNIMPETNHYINVYEIADTGPLRCSRAKVPMYICDTPSSVLRPDECCGEPMSKTQLTAIRSRGICYAQVSYLPQLEKRQSRCIFVF